MGKGKGREMVTGAAAVYMRQVGGWTGGGIHSEDWGMCATPSPSHRAYMCVF